MTIKTALCASTVAAAAALGGTAAFAEAHMGDCGEVTITEMNWASSAVVTAVADFLMTQGYGCDVTRVPSSTNPAIASVAETGEPDILTELWVNASPPYEKLRDEGKLKPLTDVITGAGEGWWIPKYLADAHPELTTLEGLKANPELLASRFHQCPDGWACKTVNGNVAAGAGLEAAGYEIFQHGSGETMATSMAAAYEDEAPWFGYYWSPTSILGKYPMVQVDLGTFDQAKHDCNSKEDCADPQVNPYPASKVLTVVTTAFADSHPEVTDMLSKLSFTADQMNQLLAWQDENSASADETAAYFLTSNTDQWSAWLDDAARENLATILQ